MWVPGPLTPGTRFLFRFLSVALLLGFRVLVRSTLSCVLFVLPSAPHEPHGDDDGHDDDEDDEDDQEVVGETELAVSSVSTINDDGFLSDVAGYDNMELLHVAGDLEGVASDDLSVQGDLVCSGVSRSDLDGDRVLADVKRVLAVDYEILEGEAVDVHRQPVVCRDGSGDLG